MVYLPHWPIPSTLGNKVIDYETVFERAKIVLKKLGDPHLKLPPIIHIAGTNGKGSVASLLNKIFLCHGYSSQLYTSPHLHDCNERILINGEKISDNDLFKIMEEVRISSQNVDLTFMESFTIGAFLYFAKNPADIAIIECGMGARIDITNIIHQKLACVITSISMDHMEYLGDSLEKITLEKAHIIKKNTPLIVAPQAHNVKNFLKILADDQKAVSYFYDDDFSVTKDAENDNFDFIWGDETILPNLSKPSLAGDHQYYNFACAIATCMAISDKFNFNYEKINHAIQNVEWSSRLQKIDNNLNKLLKNSESEIWIDGAHNEGGAYVLSQWIKQENYKKPKNNFIICGFSRKKTKVNFLNKFDKIATIYAVRVNGEPYPEEVKTICEIAKSVGIKIENGADLLEAINKIVESINYEDCRIVICGSLHLARDVKYFNEFIF